VRIRMDNLGVAQVLMDSAQPEMSAEDRLAMCRDLLWNLFRDAAAEK